MNKECGNGQGGGRARPYPTRQALGCSHERRGQADTVRASDSIRPQGSGEPLKAVKQERGSRCPCQKVHSSSCVGKCCGFETEVAVLGGQVLLDERGRLSSVWEAEMVTLPMAGGGARKITCHATLWTQRVRAGGGPLGGVREAVCSTGLELRGKARLKTGVRVLSCV